MGRLKSSLLLNFEAVRTEKLRGFDGEKYSGYKRGLAQLEMETLESRRETLCLNFAIKCTKSEKLKHMFPANNKTHEMGTRNQESFQVHHANTGRFQKSAIIYMQKLLNENQ